MPKVLVTGGAGFIGSRTVAALLEAGFEIRILDLLTSPVHPTQEWPADLQSNSERILGDVRSRRDWRRALRGVDMVLHLAAYQDYLPDFSTFLHTNATGTALLYEAIVADHLPIERVVVASSQAVYGEGPYRCANHGVQHPAARSTEQLAAGHWEIPCPVCGGDMEPLPATEGVANPQNPYGISKWTEELLALSLGRRYEIPTVALRYSITQGAGQSFHNAYSGILRVFALCVLLRKPFPIYEDGRQQRDYVYAGDVVAANLLALRDRRADYQAFNVGGAHALTVRDYATMVQEIVGVELPIEAAGRYRVGDTRHIVSDSTRLLGLGWTHSTGLRHTIAEYLDWAKHRSLPADVTDAALQRMEVLGTVRRAA